MINRIGINGKRYVASFDIRDIEDYCYRHKIPIEWIRKMPMGTHKLSGYYYLRLWGSYKNK